VGVYCSLTAFAPPLGPGATTYGRVDLDKTWHALHFLLSGTACEGSDPSQFLLSGTQIAETPDHCKFHLHAAVEAFSKVLDAVDDTELLGRLDRRRMQELDIYPGGWGENEAFDRSFLLQHLTPLRAFIARHAKEGHAVLVLIC
jgi:hypothetical protein